MTTDLSFIVYMKTDDIYKDIAEDVEAKFDTSSYELDIPLRKRLQIPDHPYRILIVRASRSRKTNSLFNLINQQTDIDKIYLYAKDLYEAKYEFLINKRDSNDLH